jgi:RNA ligase (TIGR02306 family)
MSDSRELVTLRTVDSIEPIPDADAIEVAVVGGWRVVTRKGEFSLGQPAVFFEIDSLLPLSDERFAFLAPRGTKVVDGVEYHRLKTARLRGVYSQGLLMPVDAFTDTELDSLDVAAGLGVVKFEEELPEGEQFAGPFPSEVSRSGCERAQNLTDVWPAVLSHEWVATEKIDGESITVVRGTDGTLRVASRRWQIADDGSGPLWRAVRSSGLADAIQPGWAVQGEVYGEGIRKNPLRVQGLRLVLFGVFRIEHGRGVRLPFDEWGQDLFVLQAPVYEGLVLGTTVDETLTIIDGVKSLLNPQCNAEGVVWHTADGAELPELGFRSQFKTISNRYLLKNDG